jgi:glycosyltransferase involved in cell wall biosynthesis
MVPQNQGMKLVNNKTKKISIITPAIKMGGVERAGVNFANNLIALGYEVTLISIFNQENFFSLHEKIKLIEPVDFNIKKLSLFKTIKWIRTQVKNENPDAVIVLGKFYSAITLMALIFTKFRVFISERSSPFYKWPKHITLFSNSIFRILPPVGVICQTFLAQEIQRSFHNKNTRFIILPNPVRQIIKHDVEKENIILAVGRFNDPNKGFDRLISAFALIPKTDNWKIVFVGGDEDGEYLKIQVKNLGVDDRVSFEGKSKNIDFHYSMAKIFVIPSRSEGFPNALCEAMASGLACVAFDFNCGPRDLIVNYQNGILVENDNIEKLANSIEILMENKDLRSKLGKKAMEIGNTLEAKIITKKLEQFIFNKEC